jgi:hypothetical protein
MFNDNSRVSPGIHPPVMSLRNRGYRIERVAILVPSLLDFTISVYSSSPALGILFPGRLPSAGPRGVGFSLWIREDRVRAVAQWCLKKSSYLIDMQ